MGPGRLLATSSAGVHDVMILSSKLSSAKLKETFPFVPAQPPRLCSGTVVHSSQCDIQSVKQ